MPDTDFRVLNEAKKVLDRQVYGSRMPTGDEATIKHFRSQARKELVKKLDAATNGRYKPLLQEYGDVLEAEDLITRGKKLFQTDSEKFVKSWGAMSEVEKEAVKIGLADTLRQEIGTLPVEGSASNVAGRLLGSSQRRKILKTVLGDQYEAFIGTVQNEAGAARQLSNLINNSQTPEKEGIKRFASFGGIKTAAINQLDKFIFGSKNERLAQLLTDPKLLAGELQKLNKANASRPSRLANALLGIAQPKEGGVFAALLERTKGKPVEITGRELGEYAGSLSKQKADELRKLTAAYLIGQQGKSVYIPSLGQEYQIGRGGIKKILSSSANPDKLKMIYKTEEILKAGEPFIFNRQSGNKNYRYLKSPVQIEGKNKNVGVTLENDYLHNINGLEYFLQKKTPKTGPGNKPGRLDDINSIGKNDQNVNGEKKSIRHFPSTQGRGITDGSNGIDNKGHFVNPASMGFLGAYEAQKRAEERRKRLAELLKGKRS